MADILSQDEIEALLSSLTGESPAEADSPIMASAEVRPASFATTPIGGRGDSKAISYEAYDFRRPDKFSKDQMRTLQMLNETFGRAFASSLSAYLRVATHVDLISVEQIPYEDYTRTLTNSVISVISLPPLSGNALIEIEFSVVLSMIDRLLGGPGNMVKNSTVLTEIERGLTESILARALGDLKGAWAGIVKLAPRSERIEMHAQFVQIVPPNDVVVTILFEIRVGDQRGAMSVCVPYVQLKPIAGKLSAQRWFSGTGAAAHGPAAAVIARKLEETYITCACQLGAATIHVRDLIRLKSGDTLVLDRRSTEDVDLLVGDIVKFRGRPARSGRRLALHINQRVAKQAPRALAA